MLLAIAVLVHLSSCMPRVASSDATSPHESSLPADTPPKAHGSSTSARVETARGPWEQHGVPVHSMQKVAVRKDV
jgi:hypothetical protein